MPFRPDYEGEFPTLGWGMLDWCSAYLAQPEVLPEHGQYAPPLVFTREQAEFMLRLFEVHPITGAQLVRRGVLSRPRGWGKSPIMAAIAAAVALGPVIFDGWDADGKPVGKPLSTIRKPLVEIAAVSEDQVNTNSWSPLIDMLANGPAIDEYPGLEPLAGFVNLPYGKIQKRTAEAASAKGAPAYLAVCDQTEMWVASNGGQKLYKTLKNNVTKRGGFILESPNAFTPGDGSVAESTMAAFSAMKEGRTKKEGGVYFDHREAPPETDMADEQSLLAGLAVAYGDSADISHCVIHDPPCEQPGWVNLQHIADSIWDPDTDIQLAQSDWLNQITHASDSFLSQPVWRATSDASKIVADRDTIVLGFDGSRGKAKGKPDATALIGCRVNDGHVFQLGVWEAGDHPNDWADWEPSIVEIEAEIASAFSKYRVVGFYADPGKDWRSHVNAWEAKYAKQLDQNGGIKVSANHPFEWWMTGGRSTLVERAIEQFEGAVRNGDMTHDGSATLMRHVLNARRRLSHGKLALAKENDYSPKKIDAAVAAVLAYQARLDALSRVPEAKRDFYVPRRLY